MRLLKHDELVEAMARTLYEHDADDSGWPVAWESIDEMDEPHIKQKVYLRQATAAIDALLEAVVRLKVGHWGSTPVTDKYILILRMEDRTDDA